jgi:hypothetical protein
MLINPLFILVSPPLFHKIIKLNMLDLESLTNIHRLSRKKGEKKEISDKAQKSLIARMNKRLHR